MAKISNETRIAIRERIKTLAADLEITESHLKVAWANFEAAEARYKNVKASVDEMKEAIKVLEGDMKGE